MAHLHGFCRLTVPWHAARQQPPAGQPHLWMLPAAGRAGEGLRRARGRQCHCRSPTRSPSAASLAPWTALARSPRAVNLNRSSLPHRLDSCRTGALVRILGVPAWDSAVFADSPLTRRCIRDYPALCEDAMRKACCGYRMGKSSAMYCLSGNILRSWLLVSLVIGGPFAHASVLCIDADGLAAVEPAVRGVCMGNADSSRPCPPADPPALAAPSDQPCGPCMDVPLSPDKNRGQRSSGPQARPRALLAAAVPTMPGLACAAMMPAFSPVNSPLRSDPSLTALSSVVLLI